MSRLLLCLALPLVFLSVAVAAPQSRFARTNGPANGHDIWNMAAGFPGGYVYSIAQTGDGYIWIGTSKGLVRYDGLDFVPIHRRDPNSGARFPIFGLVTDL